MLISYNFLLSRTRQCSTSKIPISAWPEFRTRANASITMRFRDEKWAIKLRLRPTVINWTLRSSFTARSSVCGMDFRDGRRLRLARARLLLSLARVLLIERVIDEAAVCTYTMLQLCSDQAPARCANISDALDVPITDPSLRTNNAPSSINTRQLPQYACLHRRLPGQAFSKPREVLEKKTSALPSLRDIVFPCVPRTVIATGISVKLLCTLVFISFSFSPRLSSRWK